MKMLLFPIIAITFFICANAFATVPTPPSSCFNSENYCYRESVSGKTINLRIFAKISADDYDSAQELLGIYFNFKNWKNKRYYSKRHMEVTMSRSCSSSWDFCHRVNYNTNGPLWRIKIQERAIYKKISTSGAKLSYEFKLDPSFKQKGIKRKYGKLHLQETEIDGEDVYVICFDAHFIPGIDILPNVAKKYIRKANLSVLRKMFDL